MTLTLRLLGRELLHLSTDPPAPAETTTPYVPQTGGEFGFAIPAAHTIDYPETRWEPNT